MKKHYSLQEISDIIAAKLETSSPSKTITGILPLHLAGPSELSFFENKKLRAQLGETSAAAVIISPSESVNFHGDKIIHDNPRLAMAVLSHYFSHIPKATGISERAVIGKDCIIAADVVIAANVVIGDKVELASGVVINPGCVIEDFVKIGKNTELKPNATVMHHCVIGDDCILHSGSVIGSDGFGYAISGKEWQKIAHLGKVKLGDNVEIGASTTVDRGTFDDTIIHDGVKLDNQIHIAHNVIIGKNTVFAACSGVAGSAVIGENCQIAGRVSILGHLTIPSNTTILSCSQVQRTIPEPGVYSSGLHVMPNKIWNKNFACLKKLNDFMKNFRKKEEDYARN